MNWVTIIRRIKGRLSLGLVTVGSLLAITPPPTLATPAGCPTPALERLTTHRVTSGDTLASVAQRYGLIPETLLGFNPGLSMGALPSGREVVIPPYNGIRASVTAGRSWRDLAQAYRVRADVLFEVNGCVATPPPTIFIPGVNWSPNLAASSGTVPTPPPHNLRGYPLPAPAPIALSYGWQASPGQTQAVFSSGVGLAVAAGTPVLAVGAGTVAYVGTEPNFGTLVVINHPAGLQTRYAQLTAPTVTAGQIVQQGTPLGTTRSLAADQPSYLYFEVRSNSELGWVAEDPGRYIQQLVIR